MEKVKENVYLNARAFPQSSSNYTGTLIRKKSFHTPLIINNAPAQTKRKPGGVVVKHSGLWTRRREFESLPGYLIHLANRQFSCTIFSVSRLACLRQIL